MRGPQKSRIKKSLCLCPEEGSGGRGEMKIKWVRGERGCRPVPRRLQSRSSESPVCGARGGARASGGARAGKPGCSRAEHPRAAHPGTARLSAATGAVRSCCGRTLRSAGLPPALLIQRLYSALNIQIQKQTPSHPRE